jgi:hypothetical protein
MGVDQKQFLSSEIDYLRNELKEQVKETNLLARNAISFSAGVVALIFITGKAGLPVSIKHIFIWLPLVLNTLMAYRSWALSQQIQRISDYLQRVERSLFTDQGDLGWETVMNNWRNKTRFALTNQTISMGLYWAVLLSGSIGLGYAII